MMKRSLLLASILACTGATAMTTETRQAYLDDFNLMSFMIPGEQSSWYWQNMGEVLPASRIKRGDDHYIPLERDLMDASEVYNTEWNDIKLGSLLQGENPSINSMIITQNGKVVFEHFNMPYNQQHLWMSNAKTIAGLLVAMLEEEGKIDVSEPLITYLPELEKSDWRNVKVIDVLNMQSGMDARENAASRQDPNSPIAQLMLAETGQTSGYYQTLLGAKTLSEGGKAFEYSSFNTQILGLLIARMEGKTLSQVIEERIWSKAGMNADALLTLTPDGYEIVHGVFSSSTEDMARYTLLYTDAWSATAKERVISEDVVNTIRTSYTENTYTGNAEMSAHFIKMIGEEPVGASYQFDAIWADGDMFKSGLQGQGIYISPDKNMTAVWFSNRGSEQNPAAYVREFMNNQK